MRTRKHEREAMLKLLERDHEDVEQLALEVLAEAWANLLERDWWCVVFAQPGVWTTIHGPFESKTMAERFANEDLFAAGPKATALVLKMHDTNKALGKAEL